MRELFLRLLEVSITGGILVLVLLLLRPFLRKSPAFIRVIAWSLVAFRLLCPFSVQSTFSLAPSYQTLQTLPVSEEDAVQSDVEESAYNEVTPEPALNENAGAVLPQMPSESGDPIINKPVNNENANKNENTYAPVPEISESVPQGNVVTEDRDEPAEEKADIVSILMLGWLIGVSLMLMYTVYSYVRVYIRTRQSIPYKNGIKMIDGMASPFIFGLGKPRIYLPTDINESDASYVIAHEKAHLRRGDHIWKPLGFAALILHWFNPLVWVGYIMFCRDIEFACDERVIGKMGIGAKRPYADALINCSASRKSIMPCPIAFGESSIKSRIKSVLGYKEPSFWVVILTCVSCVVVAVCFLTDPIAAEDIADEDPAKMTEQTDPSESETTTFDETTEPEPSEPDPTESDTAEPTEAITGEMLEVHLTSTDPTESEPTEPEPLGAVSAEAEPTEPEPSEPQPAAPKATEPEPTDTNPTEPEVALPYIEPEYSYMARNTSIYGDEYNIRNALILWDEGDGATKAFGDYNYIDTMVARTDEPNEEYRKCRVGFDFIYTRDELVSKISKVEPNYKDEAPWSDLEVYDDEFFKDNVLIATYREFPYRGVGYHMVSAYKNGTELCLELRTSIYDPDIDPVKLDFSACLRIYTIKKSALTGINTVSLYAFDDVPDDPEDAPIVPEEPENENVFAEYGLTLEVHAFYSMMPSTDRDPYRGSLSFRFEKDDGCSVDISEISVEAVITASCSDITVSTSIEPREFTGEILCSVPRDVMRSLEIDSACNLSGVLKVTIGEKVYEVLYSSGMSVVY